MVWERVARGVSLGSALLLGAGMLASSASAQDAGTAPPADAGVPTAAEAAATEPTPPDVEEASTPPTEPQRPGQDVFAERRAPTVTPVDGMSGRAPQAAMPPPVTVASVSGSATGDIPININLNGYFRGRFNWIGNTPIASLSIDEPVQAVPSDFVYMRLRLDPSITYGTDPAAPLAAIRFQLDLLDNVVFGDNVRRTGTPLFAENPSATSLNGTDVDPILLRRLWLEFMIPIGQIRIGRQPSQGGFGLLFNDGNGFKNDWTDATAGTTFDRILFATRPLTIFNTLTRGDSSPTPLIFAAAHDWLVEDPLGVGRYPNYYSSGISSDPPGATALPPPYDRPQRGVFNQNANGILPFSWLAGHGDQTVGQSTLVLAWNDPRPNRFRTTDELSAGLVTVYRYQGNTESNIYIGDVFWRIRNSVFGNRNPALIFNGEIYTIQGTTKAIAIGPGQTNLDPQGRTPNRTGANIWGSHIELGAAQDTSWMAWLGLGYASGDNNFNTDSTFTFTQRPNHPDFHVGLITYQIMLNAISATYPSQSLWSRGGVINARYLNPQFRFRLPFLTAVEIITGFVFSWADQLNPQITINRPARRGRQSCDVAEDDCFYGFEWNLGVKVAFGENDLMRWSTEFGVMNAGAAVYDANPNLTLLGQPLIWTLQSRIAMVF